MLTGKKMTLRGFFVMMFLGMAFQVSAAPIMPVSYDMLNGGTGSYTYWDDKYNGTGNKTASYAPLSGGVGDLTDGVIATSNWFTTPALYVGWQNRNPVIDFHFGKNVTINTVTFYTDDSNGSGGVSAPAGFTINNVYYGVGDPAGSAPASYTFSNLGLQMSDLSVTVHGRNQWVMVSEIAFDGVATTAPLPTGLLLFGPGLVGLAAARRKLRQ